jgi:hypothetical protein
MGSLQIGVDRAAMNDARNELLARVRAVLRTEVCFSRHVAFHATYLCPQSLFGLLLRDDADA